MPTSTRASAAFTPTIRASCLRRSACSPGRSVANGVADSDTMRLDAMRSAGYETLVLDATRTRRSDEQNLVNLVKAYSSGKPSRTTDRRLSRQHGICRTRSLGSACSYFRSRSG